MRKLKTIWIIDDDDIHQFFTKKSIEHFGPDSKISTFSNGQEALHDFNRLLPSSEQLPDIIFLDINMPEMDGWEMMDHLIKLLPQQSSKIDIYIVSSSIAASDRQRAKSYPEVSGFLIKPILPETLVHVLGDSQYS